MHMGYAKTPKEGMILLSTARGISALSPGNRASGYKIKQYEGLLRLAGALWRYSTPDSRS